MLQCLQYDRLVSGREFQHETLSLLFLVFRVAVGTLHYTLDIDKLLSAYKADGLLSDLLMGRPAELDVVPTTWLG